MLALFRAKFACISVISNPVFRWDSCKGSEGDSVKKCSRVCKKNRDSRLDLVGDLWLQAVRSCTHARHARNWSVMPAGALQDNCSVTSRLELATQSNRKSAPFWKNLTLHIPFSFQYKYLFYPRKRVSRENFERETLEKKKIDSSPIFIKRLFKFLTIVKSLKGLLPNIFSPYPFLWECCLVLWEVVRKEPISHWLMLWSSSGIRKVRKEIGLAQSRWSKKLGGLRYIG